VCTCPGNLRRQEEGDKMFDELENINSRPKPFEFYTASDLWTDEHTSEQMLAYHLNENVDLSSRNTKFIERSVEWICSAFNVGAGIVYDEAGPKAGGRDGDRLLEEVD